MSRLHVYMLVQTCSRVRYNQAYSLHFPNSCDNFVKKLVFEIRNCRRLHGNFVPLLLAQGQSPWTQVGLRLKPRKCSPLPEALDPLVLQVACWSRFSKSLMNQSYLLPLIAYMNNF